MASMTRTRYRKRTDMIAQVLRRHATLETGEQKLAFAIIAQAISDLGDFVLCGTVKTESQLAPQSAIEFIAAGGEPFASGIGLDPEFVTRMANTPLGGGEFGVLDMARNKLVSLGAQRRFLRAEGMVA